VTKILNYF